MKLNIEQLKQVSAGIDDTFVARVHRYVDDLQLGINTGQETGQFIASLARELH
jgi:hypothetical protein